MIKQSTLLINTALPNCDGVRIQWDTYVQGALATINILLGNVMNMVYVTYTVFSRKHLPRQTQQSDVNV